MNKVCSRCEIEKEITEFYNNSIRSDGKHGACKLCMNETAKPKTKEQASRDSKNYAIRNPEKVKEAYSNWYNKNKDSVYVRARKRASSPEVQVKNKQYQELNKDEIRERKRLRRLNMSPYDKQIKKLRDAFNKTLVRCKRIENRQPERHIKLIGCTLIEFKSHVESQFDGTMNWSNHGFGSDKWNIDHIQPLCSFDLMNDQQQLLAFNYKNTRPVWFNEHMRQTTREWKLPN